MNNSSLEVRPPSLKEKEKNDEIWEYVSNNPELYRVAHDWWKWSNRPDVNPKTGKNYTEKEFMVFLASLLRMWLGIHRMQIHTPGWRKITVAEEGKQLDLLAKKLEEVSNFFKDNTFQRKLFEARKRRLHENGKGSWDNFNADLESVGRFHEDLKEYQRHFKELRPQLERMQRKFKKPAFRGNMLLIGGALSVWTECLQQTALRDGKLVFCNGFKCLYDQMRNLAGLPKISEAEQKRLFSQYKKLALAKKNAD